MTLPIGVVSVEHRQFNDTVRLFQRQCASVKIETEFFNFTSLPIVKVLVPGQGLVQVPKSSPNAGTNPGLYVRHYVTYRPDVALAETLTEYPLLYAIIHKGKRVNPSNVYSVKMEYVHQIREIDLLSDEVLYEAVSGSYYGSAGADWRGVSEVDQLGKTERNIASNFFQDITVVDDDRSAMYMAGFSSVKRIRAVSTRQSKMGAGVYVRMIDPESQQLVVKNYSDAESCRKDLDIPLFARYEEAENYVMSKAPKRPAPKDASSRAAKDRKATTETPSSSSSWGDRFLGIVEGTLQVMANFLAWISGAGKPDEPPVKGKK